MASKRDYYEVLGIPKGAPADDIKRAYRKLAFEFHPDRNKALDAEEKFKEISEAYAVLSDADKRAAYDRYGHAGFSQQYSQEDIFRGANFEDMEGVFREFGFGSNFGDLFGSFFGGRSGARRREYGDDVFYDAQITLEEVAAGTTREVETRRTLKCSRCSGQGAEPGSEIRRCDACAGRGQVQQTRVLGGMRMVTVNTCGKCRGEGKTITQACGSCKGTGIAYEKEKIKVTIPAGVENGMRLRLEGMGEQGRDGAGDFYLNVYVKPHNVFQREGNDLWVEAPISFSQAALGDRVEVQTLFGKVKVDVKAGTQSHAVLRLKGEGLPNIRSARKGDQYIRLIVKVPEKLTQKQKDLLKEFESTQNNAGNAQGKRKGGLFGTF